MDTEETCMTIRILDRPLRTGGDAPVPVQAVILLAATALLTLGVLLPVPVLRVAVVLPLALLVPGYAIITATFGFQERFDTVPTMAFSALLSMASYMAVGL